MNDEKVALCMSCRRQFTEDEIAGATGCPACGSQSIPADPRKTMTATLTTHEWRLLCIWAHNWGEQCSKHGNPISGIADAIREQNPTAPPLTMGEEMAGVRKAFPTAKMYDNDGNEIHREH
jgi:predicted RNA-binding Zn-ribbon protein involved in translation (DUF1610 family)